MHPRIKLAAAKARAAIVRNGPTQRSRGRAIQRFSEALGFVYFGTIDPRRDEQVVRGLTVSATHKDSHYCSGAYEGYDVQIVDRLDVALDVTGTPIRRQWLIMQTNLAVEQDIPHTFIKPKGQPEYNHLFQALSTLQPIRTTDAPNEFTDHYELYSHLDYLYDIDHLLPPTVLRLISAHFWPLAIEVYQKSVYVYSLHPKLTTHLLETMIKNSVWLAQTLDEQSEENTD